MIIEGPEALRGWLTSAMEPICDADPAALAKYVMALLKKDKTEQELKEFCIDQLDVFLQKETKGFVERLFVVVGDKSYLTTHGTKTAKPDPVSEPLRPSQPSAAGTSTGSKLEPKADDPMVSSTDEEGAKPRTDGRRRRISPPMREDRAIRDRTHREREHRVRSRSRSRSRDRRDASRRGGVAAVSRPRVVDRRERDRADLRERRRSRSRSRSRSPHDRHDRKETAAKDSKNKEGASDSNSPMSPTRKPKKSRCRDYDEKGYCMRGDLCPYDHGPDPVVVDDSALEKMVNIGGGGSAKRIVAAMPNFSVPPPGYTPLNPPPPGVDSVYVPHSANAASVSVASEAYNPEAPALSESTARPGVAVPPLDFTVPPPPLPSVIGSRPFFPTPYSVVGASVLIRPEHSLSDGDGSYKRGRGGLSLVGRLGPPARGGSVNRYPGAADPNNKTLEVRKIPPQMNTIAKLNEHFAQFGQITNIQVRYNADPEAALITFAARHQAMSAYKSTAPILNNRFIKVFWHGGGQNGDGAPSQTVSPPDTNLTSLKDRLGAPAKRPLETAEEEKTVVYNTQKGSLTKTLYNPEVFKAGQHKYVSPQQQLQTQQLQQQQHMKKEANGASAHPVAPAPAPVARENYVEVRKRRKIEKQKKVAFLELHRKKTDLLAKQLEQQKLLIGQLGKTTNAARKKQIYMIFKSVDESVKRLKAEVEDVAKKLTALNSASQAAESGNNLFRKQTNRSSRSKADVEKETLDVELELMTQQQAGADTTGLKQRLDDLKRELMASSEHGSDLDQPLTSTPVQSAAPIGASDRKSSTSNKKLRMVIPHSASLDKRPRILSVTGFTVDQRDAVIEHLQQFGDLQDLEFDTRNDEPRAIVTFKTRKNAEQALALASDFALCPLNVQWATHVANAAERSRADSQSELVVPDEERTPEDQVTPAALLASIGDTESDESEKEDEDDGDQDIDDSAFDQM